MLLILLMFGVSLLPAMLSLALLQRFSVKASQQITRAMDAYASRGLIHIHPAQRRAQTQLEGYGELLGDQTCQFNARSPHLRCAVNPSGPCESCRFYQP